MLTWLIEFFLNLGDAAARREREKEEQKRLQIRESDRALREALEAAEKRRKETN